MIQQRYKQKREEQKKQITTSLLRVLKARIHAPALRAVMLLLMAADVTR